MGCKVCPNFQFFDIFLWVVKVSRTIIQNQNIFTLSQLYQVRRINKQGQKSMSEGLKLKNHKMSP